MIILWKNLLAFATMLTAAVLTAHFLLAEHPKLTALFGFNCAIVAVKICMFFRPPQDVNSVVRSPSVPEVGDEPKTKSEKASLRAR